MASISLKKDTSGNLHSTICSEPVKAGEDEPTIFERLFTFSLSPKLMLISDNKGQYNVLLKKFVETNVKYISAYLIFLE